MSPAARGLLYVALVALGALLNHAAGSHRCDDAPEDAPAAPRVVSAASAVDATALQKMKSQFADLQTQLRATQGDLARPAAKLDVKAEDAVARAEDRTAASATAPHVGTSMPAVAAKPPDDFPAGRPLPPVSRPSNRADVATSTTSAAAAAASAVAVGGGDPNSAFAKNAWNATFFSRRLAHAFPKCKTTMNKLRPQPVTIEHVCDFMHQVINQDWETCHLSEIDALPPEGSKCMVSFGEWRGPIASYWMATKGNNNVVAFDPDPLSYSRLASNMITYGVFPLNMCVNNDGESLNTEMYDASGSRVVKETGKHLFPVKCVPYHTLLSEYPDCFYKIDIEGYEHLLIDKLLERPPPYLSLSIHNLTMYIPDQPSFFAKLAQLAGKYGYAKDLQPCAGDHRFYEWFFKDRK